MAVTRKTGARYVIPTENEWYKAAYYDPRVGYYRLFPTQSSQTSATSPQNTLRTPDPGNCANFYDERSSNDCAPWTIYEPYYRTEVGEFTRSASAYGTFDQGGNVFQWNESVMSPTWRGYRGGSFYYTVEAMESYYRGCGIPAYESGFIGLRIASVPEPCSIMLLFAGAVAALIWRHWRQRRKTKTGTGVDYLDRSLHPADKRVWLTPESVNFNGVF